MRRLLFHALGLVAVLCFVRLRHVTPLDCYITEANYRALQTLYIVNNGGASSPCIFTDGIFWPYGRLNRLGCMR
jgi:hypothetical protein